LKAFVDAAVDYAHKTGKASAIGEFNNISGQFIRGDLYVFAYDYNGTTLTYPYRHDLIGVNRMNAMQVTGKPHIREMAETARNNSGMVYYFTNNPFHHNATVLKMSYLMDVDGTRFVGAGTYMAAGVVTVDITELPPEL
jgi:signal transduction histidine kinase